MSMGEPVYPHRAEQLRPDRELPEHSAIKNAAETIGSAVGSVVQSARELPDKLQLSQRLEEMKQRFTVIQGRARQQGAQAAHELKDKANEKLSDARVRASRLAREYPLGVVLAAAGTAFIIGLALRIWREHD